MCRSIAEGGQRCAAHTRPAYMAATPGTAEWDDAAAQYASTPEGRRVLQADIEIAERGMDFERAAALGAAVRAGENVRASNQEAARVTHSAQNWEPGSVHPSGFYDHVQTDGDNAFYTRGGRLHRMDGPAIEYGDGAEEFWRDGGMFCEMACLRGDRPPSWCTRRDGD